MYTPTKTANIGTLIVTVLLAGIFLIAGSAKLAGNPQIVVENFARWGYPSWFHLLVGGSEVALALMLLIPRTAFIGGGGVVVIMLGAAYTHTVIEGKFGPAVFTLVLLALGALVGWVRRPAFAR